MMNLGATLENCLMTVTKETLQEILKAHAEWLRYKGKQGSRANLSYADLSGADLSGANLIGANLCSACLIGANLSGANLSRASLSYACLSNANLSGADLNDAIGNGREIKSMQTDKYRFSWTNTTLAIGCQQHPLKDWLEFSDEQKASFADDGLPYLNKWLPILDSMGVFDPVKETPLHEGEDHA